MKSTQQASGLGPWVVGPVIGGLLTGLSMVALGRRVGEGGGAGEETAASPAQHTDEDRGLRDADLRASLQRLEDQLQALTLRLGSIEASGTRTPSVVDEVVAEPAAQEGELGRLIGQLERSIDKVAQLEAYALSTPGAVEPLQLEQPFNAPRLRELAALEAHEAGAGQAELLLLTMPQLVAQFGRPTGVYFSGSAAPMTVEWVIPHELQVFVHLGNGYVSYSSFRPIE